MPMNIAMDGPVGAGKSSIADAVAQRLSILHLDTGAMYRAFGLYALRMGADMDNEAEMETLITKAQVSVRYEKNGQRTMLFDEDVTDLIRTGEVSAAASAVSRYGAVRRHMVRLQQALAQTTDMLIDGRDAGTVILPDSPCKIFLTASAEERARRRWLQNTAKGDMTPYEQVLRELNARDEQDMNRKTDPLRMAPDAILVDSTHMSVEEVVDHIVSLVEGVYGKR
ncbi:MAG: (d)CMP kinase [Clostridia bacterium]|nr:(d)CMP kinase [Clostridia bacterium]